MKDLLLLSHQKIVRQGTQERILPFWRRADSYSGCIVQQFRRLEILSNVVVTNIAKRNSMVVGKAFRGEEENRSRKNVTKTTTQDCFRKGCRELSCKVSNETHRPWDFQPKLARFVGSPFKAGYLCLPSTRDIWTWDFKAAAPGDCLTSNCSKETEPWLLDLRETIRTPQHKSYSYSQTDSSIKTLWFWFVELRFSNLQILFKRTDHRSPPSSKGEELLWSVHFEQRPWWRQKFFPYTCELKKVRFLLSTSFFETIAISYKSTSF